MSNLTGWYTKGVEHFMQGDIDLLGDTIKAVILNEALYAVNLDTNEALSDIPAGARVATVTLTNVAVTGGVFGADTPLNFGAIAAGAALNAIAYYKDSGVAATSWLIGFVSGNYAVGLPKTPNGVDSIKVYNKTAGTKIGKLGGHT